MIGRVSRHGGDPGGLVGELYRPAGACADSAAHLVAGWRNPAELEPPPRQDGERDVRDLAGLLRQPLALLGNQARAEPTWHCEVRAAPEDPELGDSAWMRIAGEVMNRNGLSAYGEESQGVPWVAVRHGGGHIHIVAALARQDGSPAHLDNEFHAIGDVLRAMETEYGLQKAARIDHAAAGPSVSADPDAARLAKASFPRPAQPRPSAPTGRRGAPAPTRRPGNAAGSARRSRPGGPR